MLWGISEYVLFVSAVISFLIALEAGFRIGYRRSGESHESENSHVSSLQSAALGLLALLLGFTFFMAVSRFDTRKTLILDEANAIGTTSLRAQLLSPSHRVETNGLLRQYVEARLAFHDASNDPRRVEAATAEASLIEEKLWAMAVIAAAQDARSVPTGLFIQSVNEVIDIREKRQAAQDNHVPEAVIFLLFAVSVAAMGLLGYGGGLCRLRHFSANALLALLVAVVLTTILDIDRPRRGVIQVSQDSLLRLKATLEQQVP